MKPMLLIEDTESDIFLLQHAVGKLDPKPRVEVARDGAEAVSYLKGEGEFGNRKKHPMPGVVLLDLHLPCLDGFEVLQWIRNTPRVADLPVIVVTASNLPEDIERAYALGATHYVVKPALVTELVEVIRLITRFWLEGNRPPHDCADWMALSVPDPAEAGCALETPAS